MSTDGIGVCRRNKLQERYARRSNETAASSSRDFNLDFWDVFLCRRDELQEVYAPHRGENRQLVSSAQMASVASGSRHGICLCVSVQEGRAAGGVCTSQG